MTEPGPPPRPFWLAGRPALGPTQLAVTNPYDGSTVARVHVPSAGQVDDAVSGACTVAADLAARPASDRSRWLAHVADRLGERAEEAAQLVVSESGKPISWARAEITRAAGTFRWAAEEARRWSGELQRLDTDPSGADRLALTRRFPRGPVLGITPFNFPVNLVAHKLAPAIAVGAPIIVKPAPATPLSALLLGELLAETDMPAGSWSVLPVPNEAMGPLVEDPRLPVVSFTGSGPVGWSIQQAVPHKHVTLELGGNAAAVVLADFADLDRAAERIATFATYQAGQSCISVQRVFVEHTVYREVVARIVDHVSCQLSGDPRDERTHVGPQINEDAARRIETWVEEAVAAGARILVGGTREGACYSPTVLTDVPPDAKLNREEVFGPVVVVSPVACAEDAFTLVNDSPFGLQAGVFTSDLRLAFQAHRDLVVGGVIIGDVPSYRAEQMAYGGVKASGVGREGVRYAMEDLTVERVLVLSHVPL
jgi:aldehyde dehydrogenase (NAD+)